MPSQKALGSGVLCKWHSIVIGVPTTNVITLIVYIPCPATTIHAALPLMNVQHYAIMRSRECLQTTSFDIITNIARSETVIWFLRCFQNPIYQWFIEITGTEQSVQWYWYWPQNMNMHVRVLYAGTLKQLHLAEIENLKSGFDTVWYWFVGLLKFQYIDSEQVYSLTRW